MAKKDIEQTSDAQVEPSKTEFKFNFILQVINPFLNYQKGSLITTDEAIQTVIDNGDLINCNRLPRS